MSRLPLALAAAALLAACEAAPLGAGAPETAAADGPSLVDLLPAPDAAAESGTADAAADPPADTPTDTPADPPTDPPVPHVYLALQPSTPGHAHSVIFAIDGARDGTPSDDPAIRLTPEAGNCNPQEMRGYAFPDGAAPVVSEAEQARGLTPGDLPAFLAAEVTGRMIEADLAAEPEDTRPLNVCTRKLWERLVVAGNADRVAGVQQ